jgi:glycosyltransferase involved in cell wall biosynthesis
MLKPTSCESFPSQPRMLKVSIITVSLNCRDRIERTIHSVLTQRHADVEYIVVDGASTDGTWDIIQKYRAGLARCISEPDGGIYQGMNKGLALAGGDVVAFLNAGDTYTSRDVVSQVVAALEAANLDAVYGDLAYIDPKTNRVTRFWTAGRYVPGSFSWGWVPPHPTFFCRTAAYKKLGVFDERYRISSDFDLMFRFIEEHHISVGYLPHAMVLMPRGGAANTWRGMFRGNWETILSLRRHGFRLPLAYFGRKPLWKLSQVLEARRKDVSVQSKPDHAGPEEAEGAERARVCDTGPLGIEAVPWNPSKPRSRSAPVRVDTG